ncbi:SDR family NAD(P)-dependent oxidoreductase [Streptomyces ziwulingensis]|uniref:Type I polyketide synthase n=1 Tax=Streptomyces ziwulingensis TaxID=1045501 RepID=A0ABP9AUD6_9ACTN
MEHTATAHAPGAPAAPPTPPARDASGPEGTAAREVPRDGDVRDSPDTPTGLEIAVIGLSCRFPGAPDAAAFWRNLSSGTESITVFTPEELKAAGVPQEQIDDPDYVPAQGVLEGADLFDAEFFGFNPKEAGLLDPQHRVLLECAWAALEDAGYDPKSVPGPVGVYAGSYYGSYLAQLATDADPTDAAEEFARNLANEKDYLATRIAYKFGLVGPALTVQTACSTSLVAVHLACQALLSGDCDTALAGGATVRARQAGYVFQPGGIFSSDGHCRPFDAAAQGTVASNGAGLVVLKRLEDALADGDPIRAVIKGSAVGNDGAERVGFTAPGAAGQARIIAAALETAGTDPATVGYVETHGSGTPVGDPIEIEALTRVFRRGGAALGGCAIGAVKGNIGHTHVASGIAGLIKTVLALQHRQLPPSLHFDKPNPDIDFDATPFYVNTRLAPWRDDRGPRRAGVSSFGMGGTGAHVILEEASSYTAPGPSPAATAATTGASTGATTGAAPASDADRPQLLVLSARTAAALDEATDRLAERLETAAELPLPAVAHTLQSGRRVFPHRRFLVADGLPQAAAALRARDPRGVRGGHHEGPAPEVAFLLPGLGEQRPGMGRELYDRQPVFRAAVDRCAEILRPHLGLDLRTLIHPAPEPATTAGGRPDLRRLLGRGTSGSGAPRTDLDRTLYAQPAVFVLEYALGLLWQSWGVRPAALIGYSIGEYAAACLAGVLSLEDALALVASRARLIEELPAGAMLAVPLSERRVRSLLDEGLSLAAVNGAELCVVAGQSERIDALAERLASEDVAVRALRTSHAFHSHMMEPVVERFTELVAGVPLAPPRIPYVSNVTGDWITPEQATDPVFWGRHLRHPVRFADGVARLWGDAGRLLLEIGPGQSLSSLALQARPAGQDGDRRPPAFASLPGEYDRQREEGFLLATAGKLWSAGVGLDWPALRGSDAGAGPRVSLPSYPFERRRHWIDPGPARRTGTPVPSLAKKPDLADWFQVPVWEPLPPHPAGGRPGVRTGTGADWLLFLDEQGTGDSLAEGLTAAGHRVTTVRAGDGWRRLSDSAYEIAPGDGEDYRRLAADLDAHGRFPGHLVHLWTVGPRRPLDVTLERGFSSLLRFNHATAGRDGAAVLDIAVVTSDAHAAPGTGEPAPEKATVLGPCLVLPLEQPETACRAIDITPAAGPAGTDRLLSELLHPSGRPLTALRGRDRWAPGHRPVRLTAEDAAAGRPRPGGVHLITGGFGGVGLTLARHLARTPGTRLVLVGRSPLPPRETWDDWLAEHPADDPAARRVLAVRELEELGAEVLPVAADVTDEARMRAVADEVVGRFGAVHGLVHAAGVPAVGLAQLKDVDTALNVLAPKVAGGLVVEALARELRPDYTVLCSSTLALTGGVGQVDYVAANAFLDALAHGGDPAGGPRLVSVNWDGWQDVGMAARLIGESGPRPTGGSGTGGGRGGPVDHPLIDECLADDDNRAVYAVSLSTATSWLIDEHRMAGSAVVPGTGHLELVRAAHEHQHGGTGVELREVTFLSPVVVGEDRRHELRVVLDKTARPTRFAVVSRAVPEDPGADGDGDGWHLHSTGEVGPLTDPGPARRHDVAALIADAGMRDLGAVEHTGPMGFGPRSRCLRRVHLGEREALAELELPEEFTDDLRHLGLHPSLLDLAAGFHGMNLAREFRIPLSYGKLRLFSPLPRRIFSHHRFHGPDEAGKEIFTADFTLLDADGREVAVIEDFVLKRVADLSTRIGALRDGTSAEVAPYRFPPAARSARADGAAGGLRDHLDQGIRPEEGVEALLRVLGSDVGPQVVVVTKDLDAVRADVLRTSMAAPAPAAGADTGAHPRPQVGTAYAAPADSVQARLAALWAELLGLSEIGIHDDFFELGGHSLLGVQLVARVRRMFGVNVPLSALFEALTVAEFADVLRPRLGASPVPQNT